MHKLQHLNTAQLDILSDMNYLFFCFIFLSLLLYLTESAKILAFIPLPSKSHHRIIYPILKELSNRGHDVTFYSGLTLEDKPDNLRYIQIKNYFEERKKNVTRSQWKEAYKWTTGLFLPFSLILYKYVGLGFNNWILDQQEVQDLVNSDEKYDAIIMETMMLQEPFVALSHKFNAPIVEIMMVPNIHWMYWNHGIPSDTSYIADMSLDYTDNMSFSQRLINTIVNLFLRVVLQILTPSYQAIMDERIRYKGWESRPPMMEMVSKIPLVLLNSHCSINYPHALGPHVKEIAGINIQPLKPLPKDLQTFLDDAKDGVIYFSLGSTIGVSNMLTNEQREIFAKVFSELKLKVLWKWEKEFPNLPRNVKIGKWFPQQEILAHKNVKLFIMHGGMQSLVESINYAVPTLGIPLVTDQYRNIRFAAERMKCTYMLSFDNITHDSVMYSINEVLKNPTYKLNAEKSSLLLNDRELTPLETAIYWTEYVIRHKGAAHLRPAIATMPWYQQAMIDVYSAMTAILLATLYILYRILRYVRGTIYGYTRNKNISKKKKKH